MFYTDGYHTDDPVWDGEGCSSNNNCCSEPSMPWTMVLYCQIPQNVNEDIEVRLYCNEISSHLMKMFLLGSSVVHAVATSSLDDHSVFTKLEFSLLTILKHVQLLYRPIYMYIVKHTCC